VGALLLRVVLPGLIASRPTDAPAPPMLPPRDGFLFLDRDKFAAAFAADVPEGRRRSWLTLRSGSASTR